VSQELKSVLKEEPFVSVEEVTAREMTALTEVSKNGFKRAPERFANIAVL
jgi:hypothetical protein